MAFVTAVAVRPWLSALDVSFRDVNRTGLIPQKGAFCIGLNPLAEVIALGYPGTTNVTSSGRTRWGRSSALRSLCKADKDALGLIGECMHAHWKPTKERASGD